MANIYLMVPKYKPTEASDLFSSHSGNVHIVHYEGGAGKEIMHIYAESPTTSHFDDAPVGSLLFDTASGGLAYYHQTSSTWVELGDLT